MKTIFPSGQIHTQDTTIDYFASVTDRVEYMSNPYINLGLNYTYHFNRKWELGFDMTWFWSKSASYTFFLDNGGNRVFEEHTQFNHHLFTFMPRFNYTWFSSDFIHLYSGLGLGFTYSYNPYYNMQLNQSGALHRFFPAMQANFLGIKVGKKYKGFVEFGFGNRGMITAGFSINFGK